MAVSKELIKKIIAPYTVNVRGVDLIKRDYVSEVEDTIFSKYKSVYINIEESVSGDEILVIGNMGTQVCKPIYKIRIQD